MGLLYWVSILAKQSIIIVKLGCAHKKKVTVIPKIHFVQEDKVMELILISWQAPTAHSADFKTLNFNKDIALIFNMKNFRDSCAENNSGTHHFTT